MEYLIGLVLSLAAAGLVTITGLERDRALYPTVLIVNAGVGAPTPHREQSQA